LVTFENVPRGVYGFGLKGGEVSEIGSSRK